MKFKTNINCNNCLAKVKPFLDQEKDIQEWSVDISTADKILTVKGENINKEKIESTLKKAGFVIKN